MYDKTKDKVGQLYKTGKEKAGAAYNKAKQKAANAKELAKNKANQVAKTAQNKLASAKDKIKGFLTRENRGGSGDGPNFSKKSGGNESVTQAKQEVDKRFDRRPSFRKATDVKAKERATDVDGVMSCIKCDKTLTGEKQANGKRDYQLGHSEDSPWVEQQDVWKEAAENGEDFTRQDVIDKYQKGVEIECVQCNASGGAKIAHERKMAKKLKELD